MVKTTKWGNHAWVEHISDKEMPALSSTIRILENLANNDTMSLARLGQSVLHDYALTSSILKVANSAAYMGRAQVSTVSRAAVVLGFTTIKNICITAKLLGSLLENNKLSEPIYERLLRQMARSFHAGMITQILMSKYDEQTKEETFIAALLHHLGESAFWSIGGQITEDLHEKLQAVDPTEKLKINRIVSSTLGTTFDKISIGLASNWNLSQHFIRSLEDPQHNSPELQIVDLADRLSICIANPEQNSALLHDILIKMGELTGVNEKVLRKRIEQCTAKTEKLLQSYGANILIQYLHPGASALPEDLPPPLLTGDALQLQILRELTFLTIEKGDFNVVIQTALEGIYRGVGMDRVIVLLKSGNKKTIEPRFMSGENSEQLKAQFTLNIKSMENVFSYALKEAESIWVNGFDDKQWGKLISKPIRNITCKDGFFIAPIMWDKICIGLIYADRNNADKSGHGKLTEQDFMSFTHFAQQTNLCLSIILKKQG